MTGIKHLIQCHCVLPTMRNRGGEPVFHSFVVFSIVEDDGTVLPKNAQCNNCGVIHRVVDISRSELTGRESVGNVISIEDISLMLPSELSSILATYKCDVATWELVNFIFSNKKWGSRATLSRETSDSIVRGKVLTIGGERKFSIQPFETPEDISE